MTSTRFGFAVLALILAPLPARPADRVQPGLWEVTATVELPGAATPLPPTTQTACLSQHDVDAELVPELAKGGCRVSDARRSGDKVTWKLDCGPAGKGQGEIVYQGPTAYQGWMTLETGGTVVRTTIRAKRVGGC
jgi:hypothetical protein